MSTSVPEVKSHLLFLDSVRALAALYVMVHHCVLHYYDPNFYPYKGIDDYLLPVVKTSALRFFLYGNYAVDLFIVLSGFSLMLSIVSNNFTLKGGSAHFFWRRAWRILPPYYLAMALSLTLIWLFVGTKTNTHWDTSIPVNLKDIFYHLALVHDFWKSKAYHINHAFWSIAVECRIYLFFPLLIIIWKRFGVWLAVSFSIAVSAFGSFLLYLLNGKNADIALGTGVSPNIILFTLGMVAANLSFSQNTKIVNIRKIYEKFSGYAVIFGMIGVLFTATVCRHYLRIYNDAHVVEMHLESKVYDIFLGVIFALALFAFAESGKSSKKPKLLKMLLWRPLIFTGTFSYSLYLIHSPLIAILAQYVVTPLKLDKLASVGLLILFGTPLILLSSYCFFYLFERPFLTSGKKSRSSAIERQTAIHPAP